MKNPLLWIVIVILLAGLGWWWYTSMQTPAPGQVSGATDEQFVDDSKDGGVGVTVTVGSPTIVYSDAGFSPQTLTIKKGTTVTFVNQSTHEMWIGSDEHPSHTGYDGTSRETHCAPGYTGAAPLDQCGPGSSFSFTFNEVGSWGYHNHREDDDHGTIVVVE